MAALPPRIESLLDKAIEAGIVTRGRHVKKSLKSLMRFEATRATLAAEIEAWAKRVGSSNGRTAARRRVRISRWRLAVSHPL